MAAIPNAARTIGVERRVARLGIDVPVAQEVFAELGLKALGISSVIWATGIPSISVW